MAGAAAEGADVAFDPLKCRDLVEQPVIARHAVVRFGAQRGLREPAEPAAPVVDRHADASALGEPAALVDRTAARPPRPPPPVHPPALTPLLRFHALSHC